MECEAEIRWHTSDVSMILLRDGSANNHCSWALVTKLANALEEVRVSGARVTVLASKVPGHWLEHAWLPDLIATLSGQPTTGPTASWWRCYDELRHTDVVTIAAISGDTSGGGCELGWYCDLRVAEKGVFFSQPEVRLGVGTGLGGTSRLTRLVGRSIAAQMVLEGAPMRAERLYELGAVNKIVEEGQAADVALQWGSRLADMPPQALSGMKRMLTEGEDLPLSEAIMNDQKIFQTFAGGETALSTMRRAQENIEKGQSLRNTYWPDLFSQD